MAEDEKIERKSKSEKEQDYSKFSMKEFFDKQCKDESAVRQREALRLVRVQITSNNPNHKNLVGDFFCARNKFVEEVKKFVPFNKPTHIPKILYNMIKEKKCQMFREERLSDGNKVMKPYLIDMYNVVDLPPLTSEEFNAIRQHQLAEGSVNG